MVMLLGLILQMNSLLTPARAEEKIFVKSLETFKVPSPLLVTECEQGLWVYSQTENSLYKMGTNEVYPIREKDLKNLTNLTCYENRFLVSYSEGKKNKQQHLAFLKKDSGGFYSYSTKVVVPRKGSIADLNCVGNKCYLISSGTVFSSTNLEKWQQIKIPKKEKIDHIKIDISSNPFDDWNDKLSVFPGEYTRVLAHKGGGLTLLEPFAANIVVKKEEIFSRWGQWGAWEGYLMVPKSIQATDEEIYFIGDVGLKLIFVYGPKGEYYGVLSFKEKSKDKWIEVKYPIRMLWKRPHLYVLDFLENEVLRIQINLKPEELKKKLIESKDLKSDQPGRVNFYRRVFVLKDRLNHKCLACHDGTVTPSAKNFLPQMTHHPFDKEVKVKTDLPLSENKFISCASCHDPHHGSGKNVMMKKSPFLRKNPSDLCVSCHAENKGDQSHQTRKKGSDCLDCHTSHGGVEKSLKMPQDALCMSCHKPERIEHPPLENFIATERAENLSLFENQISCQTCHAPHLHKHFKNQEISQDILNDLKKGLLKPHGGTSSFCASCHGAKTPELFSKFHERMGRKIKK